MDDDKIIDLYWERDEDALVESERRYGRYCSSIALRILNNMESSEECVNDTWLHAWNAMPPQKPDVLRIFLGSITRNLSLNRVRDLSREKRGGGQAVLALDELADCVSDTETPDRVLEDQEITKIINKWLSSLKKEERVAFIRRYWFCDSLSEVSTLMGWSESKTNSLLRRLRIRLKNHMIMEEITL